MLRIRGMVSMLVFFGVASALSTVPSSAQTPAAKMKDCLLIEDMTKERLDCFDAIIPPEPRPSPKKAKVVAECRFFKEEDERLKCYDGFAMPKQPSPKAAKSPTPKTAPLPK
jgi:hypothetical protein